jgi:hypothetical protein
MEGQEGNVQSAEIAKSCFERFRLPTMILAFASLTAATATGSAPTPTPTPIASRQGAAAASRDAAVRGGRLAMPLLPDLTVKLETTMPHIDRSWKQSGVRDLPGGGGVSIDLGSSAFLVRNQGKSASSTTSLRLRRESGHTHDFLIPALAPGESTQFPLNQKVISTIGGAGELVLAVVDPGNSIPESNEKNNSWAKLTGPPPAGGKYEGSPSKPGRPSSSGSYKVPKEGGGNVALPGSGGGSGAAAAPGEVHVGLLAPDLTVEMRPATFSRASSGPRDLRNPRLRLPEVHPPETVIRNQGKSASSTTWVRLTTGGGMSVALPVPGLAPGESTTIAVDQTVTKKLGGSADIVLAVVDPANAVTESNEKNNSWSKTARGAKAAAPVVPTP